VAKEDRVKAFKYGKEQVWSNPNPPLPSWTPCTQLQPRLGEAWFLAVAVGCCLAGCCPLPVVSLACSCLFQFPISAEDDAALKYDCDRCLTVLGFCHMDSIPRACRADTRMHTHVHTCPRKQRTSQHTREHCDMCLHNMCVRACVHACVSLCVRLCACDFSGKTPMLSPFLPTWSLPLVPSLIVAASRTMSPPPCSRS
jgi:hypothetical protein